MSTFRVVAVACLILVTGVVVVALAPLNSGPPASLTVRGFKKTNRWTAADDGLAGYRKCVCAIVELTNTSSRSISFWGWDLGSDTSGPLGPHPYSRVQYQTPTGWKDPKEGYGFGIGQQFTLARSQTITFEVLLEQDRRCKVELDVSDGRAPNKLLQHLPRWIVLRLPWARTSRTVTTDEIDLRATTL